MSTNHPKKYTTLVKKSSRKDDNIVDILASLSIQQDDDDDDNNNNNENERPKRIGRVKASKVVTTTTTASNNKQDIPKNTNNIKTKVATTTTTLRNSKKSNNNNNNNVKKQASYQSTKDGNGKIREKDSENTKSITSKPTLLIKKKKPERKRHVLIDSSSSSSDNDDDNESNEDDTDTEEKDVDDHKNSATSVRTMAANGQNDDNESSTHDQQDEDDEEDDDLEDEDDDDDVNVHVPKKRTRQLANSTYDISDDTEEDDQEEDILEETLGDNDDDDDDDEDSSFTDDDDNHSYVNDENDSNDDSDNNNNDDEDISDASFLDPDADEIRPKNYFNNTNIVQQQQPKKKNSNNDSLKQGPLLQHNTKTSSKCTTTNKSTSTILHPKQQQKQLSNNNIRTTKYVRKSNISTTKTVSQKKKNSDKNTNQNKSNKKGHHEVAATKVTTGTECAIVSVQGTKTKGFVTGSDNNTDTIDDNDIGDVVVVVEVDADDDNDDGDNESEDDVEEVIAEIIYDSSSSNDDDKEDCWNDVHKTNDNDDVPMNTSTDSENNNNYSKTNPSWNDHEQRLGDSTFMNDDEDDEKDQNNYNTIQDEIITTTPEQQDKSRLQQRQVPSKITTTSSFSLKSQQESESKPKLDVQNANEQVNEIGKNNVNSSSTLLRQYDNTPTVTKSKENDDEEICNDKNILSPMKTSTGTLNVTTKKSATDQVPVIKLIPEDCSTMLTPTPLSLQPEHTICEGTDVDNAVVIDTTSKHLVKEQSSMNVAENEQETITDNKRQGIIRRESSIQRGKWKLGTKIGVGAFGVVHVGMNMMNGTLMAVKSIKIVDSSSTNNVMKDAEMEIQLLKSLHHINIVRYLGAEMDKHYLHIFQEWVPAGSITSMLMKFGPFPLLVIQNYTLQILHGLQYLHMNHIMHRDIKGSNVLVNDDGIVKLADFGSSKRFKLLKQDMMMSLTMRGTPYFMAPEVFEEKYSTKADIWSVGCVAVQMITGSPPWKNLGLSNPVSLFKHISKTNDVPQMSYAAIENNIKLDAFKSMMKTCFDRVPENRPSAAELIKNSFFSSDDFVTSIDDPSDSVVGLYNSPTSSTKRALKHTISSSPVWANNLSPIQRLPIRRCNSGGCTIRSPMFSPPLPKKRNDDETNRHRLVDETTQIRIGQRSPTSTSPIPDGSEWPTWARKKLLDNKENVCGQMLSPLRDVPQSSEKELGQTTTKSILTLTTDSLAYSDDDEENNDNEINKSRSNNGKRSTSRQDDIFSPPLIGVQILTPPSQNS